MASINWKYKVEINPTELIEKTKQIQLEIEKLFQIIEELKHIEIGISIVSVKKNDNNK